VSFDRKINSLLIKNDPHYQLEERFLKTWQLLFALIRASSHYENVSTFDLIKIGQIYL